MRRKAGNYSFYKNFTYHVPGVGGMFMLLAWLLVGALIGNLASLPFVMMLGESGTDYAMVVSYPLMFIPAMIYASSKSSRASLNQKGVMLDNNHFSPLGIALCLLIVAVGTVALGFVAEPITALLPDMPEWLEKALKGMTQGNIWLNFLCVSIFAPFFEEWLCRGMVLRGLLGNNVKPVWAIIISSVFFALIHANPWQAIPAFLLGALFGYVYYRTGSLKLTMAMHFVNNTLSLTLSNIEGLKEIETWRDLITGPEYWAIYAACILIVALTVLAFKRIPLAQPQGNCDITPSLFEIESE